MELVDYSKLDPQTSEAIKSIIGSKQTDGLDLEDMWQFLDDAWDDLNLDNRNLDYSLLSDFYSHPVWILNGFFVEHHDESVSHRKAISSWIKASVSRGAKILDFGGGFGSLALLIAEREDLGVHIFEPYPSEYAQARTSLKTNIKFVSEYPEKYDVIVCTDVLEHVENPISLFYEMIKNTKLHGNLIIGNCFFPVIKCHLPVTFHFRYTFTLFAALLGLKNQGLCGSSYATVYQRVREVEPNWLLIKLMIMLSKLAFPFLRGLHWVYSLRKKVF